MNPLPPTHAPLQEHWAFYEENGFDELEDLETDDNDDDETYDRKGRKRPNRKPKVRLLTLVIEGQRALVIYMTHRSLTLFPLQLYVNDQMEMMTLV